MEQLLAGGHLADPAAALAEIRAWWASGRAEDHRSGRVFAIAGTRHDQPIPANVQNPYWEILRYYPTVDFTPGLITPHTSVRGLKAKRSVLARRYSWAICSPGDMMWLAGTLDGRPLVEVGAGSGYWAWQACQAGLDVIAYEPHRPADNHYTEGGQYFPLERAGASSARRHPDRALLLCWPSYDSTWAAQALAAYQGDMFIYTGAFDCCAERGLYAQIRRDWTVVGQSPHHRTWWGIDCRLIAYQRRSRTASP